MSGVEALTGMRMQDAGWRNPSFHQWGKTIPSHLRAFATTDQNTPPQAANTTPEETQLRRVTGHGMVLVVARHNLSEPFADLARTVMLPALKLGLNGFELRNHTLGRRNSPDSKGPTTPEMPTIMGEPQKYEGLRFSLTTPFSVSEGKPPKLNQPRLVRMQFQTELHQPLLKITQKPLGVSPILKTQHKIIGVADHYDIARCHFLAPSFHPQIEYLMQVHIREQR